MTTLEKLRERREEILAIAAKYGATNLRVFGSVARGEDDIESDIDFLVDWDESDLFRRMDLAFNLSDVLDKRKIDLVSEKSIHWYIRDKVISEAVPLGSGLIKLDRR